MYWTNDGILIDTKRGDMLASIGDYIILTDHGDFYPCKPEIFEMNYKEVKEWREKI
mgnify:CR=1 FL=1